MSTSAKRSGDEFPDGGDHDASYKTGGNDTVPVVADDNPVDSGVNAATADSDEQLEADDKDAIDTNNIVGERTRGAAKKAGTYREPSDEEGLEGAE